MQTGHVVDLAIHHTMDEGFADVPILCVWLNHPPYDGHVDASDDGYFVKGLDVLTSDANIITGSHEETSLGQSPIDLLREPFCVLELLDFFCGCLPQSRPAADCPFGEAVGEYCALKCIVSIQIMWISFAFPLRFGSHIVHDLTQKACRCALVPWVIRTPLERKRLLRCTALTTVKMCLNG